MTMTDESCGCKCYECRVHDLHRCGREQCGYTRRLKPKPDQGWFAIGNFRNVQEILAVALKRCERNDARARLTEWAEHIEHTETLPPAEREELRRALFSEIWEPLL